MLTCLLCRKYLAGLAVTAYSEHWAGKPKQCVINHTQNHVGPRLKPRCTKPTKTWVLRTGRTITGFSWCSSEMTMSGECDVSQVVTTFLLNTCRLPPRTSRRNIEAASLCAVMATKRPTDFKEVEYIPLITGSVADFYIEPMLPHVCDIDVMYYDNTTRTSTAITVTS